MMDETLSPDRRRKGRPEGTEVALSDGRMWTLAAYVPRPGRVFDDLYDANQVAGSYEVADLQLAAFHLLAANYRVTIDEGVALLLGAEPADLVRAVEAALGGDRRGYAGLSDWIGASLWANGIDPAEVPPELLRAVMTTLVASGRAIPEDQFVTSAETARKKAGLLKQAEAF
jgi:hypothetical protein